MKKKVISIAIVGILMAILFASIVDAETINITRSSTIVKRPFIEKMTLSSNALVSESRGFFFLEDDVRETSATSFAGSFPIQEPGDTLVEAEFIIVHPTCGLDTPDGKNELRFELVYDGFSGNGNDYIQINHRLTEDWSQVPDGHFFNKWTVSTSATETFSIGNPRIEKFLDFSDPSYIYVAYISIKPTTVELGYYYGTSSNPEYIKVYEAIGNFGFPDNLIMNAQYTGNSYTDCPQDLVYQGSFFAEPEVVNQIPEIEITTPSTSSITTSDLTVPMIGTAYDETNFDRMQVFVNGEYNGELQFIEAIPDYTWTYLLVIPNILQAQTLTVEVQGENEWGNTAVDSFTIEYTPPTPDPPPPVPDPPLVDTDGDGYYDENDAFPNDPDEWKDTDGDGVGDNADAYPFDPTRTEEEEEPPIIPDPPTIPGDLEVVIIEPSTNPVFSIQRPTINCSGSYVADDGFSFISLDVTDGYYTNLVAENGLWSAQVTTEGTTSTITVTVIDTDGDTTNDVILLLYNVLNKPTVTIITPENNTSTFAEEIFISGVAHDDMSITGVTWKNTNNDLQGSFTGTDNWQGTVQLDTGINRIVITPYDEHGPGVSETILILKTQTFPPVFNGPEIRIESIGVSGNYNIPMEVEYLGSEEISWSMSGVFIIGSNTYVITEDVNSIYIEDKLTCAFDKISQTGPGPILFNLTIALEDVIETGEFIITINLYTGARNFHLGEKVVNFLDNSNLDIEKPTNQNVATATPTSTSLMLLPDSQLWVIGLFVIGSAVIIAIVIGMVKYPDYKKKKGDMK